MEKPSRIPLFPLDVVLLPAMTLPLHIFEPRYRTMVGRCLDEEAGFGMVLASAQGVATVGCAAKILRKVKDYPDGRLDILTEGREVFRMVEVFDDKEYYEAQIEYLADEPFEADASQESRVTELFCECHALLFGQAWVDESPRSPANFSYRMAARLPMELQQRQALLEMRQENKRRQTLMEWLAKFLPRLIAREKGRRTGGGNGNVFN